MSYKKISRCEREYDRIDADKIEFIKGQLIQRGGTISGSNPWKAETHDHDVDLYGTWDPLSEKLTIKVDSPVYVSCSAVWDTIDPLMQQVQAMPKKPAPTTPEPQPTPQAPPTTPVVTPTPAAPVTTQPDTNPLAASVAGYNNDHSNLLIMGGLICAAVAWYRFRK